MLVRTIIIMLLLQALAAFEAQAQIRKVGILVSELGRAESQANKGFMEELSRLGYRDRQEIVFEIRNAKRDRGAFLTAASDLVRQAVEVILTTGASATRAAAAASRTIPIVFIYPGDPSVAGFAPDPRPGDTNITGIAGYADEKLNMRLALLREIVPGLLNLHVFFDWNNRYSRDHLARAETEADKLNLRLLGHPIKSVEELDATIAGLASDRGDAIFQIPDDLVESAAERLFELARQKKIPTMFNEEVWAIKGALAAHGPNYLQMGRQAGRMAGDILRGRKPDSLPIERASRFDLTLNYRTARFIGIRLSREILAKADKVIR